MREREEISRTRQLHGVRARKSSPVVGAGRQLAISNNSQPPAWGQHVRDRRRRHGRSGTRHQQLGARGGDDDAAAAVRRQAPQQQLAA